MIERKSNTVTVRAYSENDITRLDQLTSDFQEYMVGIDRRHELRSFASLEEAHQYMTKLIADAQDMEGVVYVAEEDGEIVGFVQGIINRHADSDDVMYHTSHTPTVDGWIGVLYVDSSQRGKGTGRALFDEIKNYFKQEGCQTLRLLVMKDNENSVKFYEKNGMTIRDVEMVVSL